MKSMTGHGRGECSRDGYKIAVEISSVNRRQLELALSLPPELVALEPRIRDVVNQHVSRGRLSIKVLLHAQRGVPLAGLRLNLELARAYAQALERLARELALPDTVSLDTLVRAPGVFETAEDPETAERFGPSVDRALRQALAALVRMREREGAHLASDLSRRLRSIRASLLRVKKRAPEVVKRYRRQLHERIAAAGLPLPAVDDERLLREIVYFTDRSDISEELTRLESHLQQFQDGLESAEPMGRTLDFLAQEMNREVNTLGAKANDGRISREVVHLKAELEKLREQIQNVE